MRRGNGMTGEMIFFLAVTVSIAVYGIWKYSQAESNDYAVFTRTVQDCNDRISVLERKFREQDDLKKMIEEFSVKIQGFGTDVMQAQEHNALLREGLIELKEKLATKRPVMSFPKEALKVEFINRTPPRPSQPPKPVPMGPPAKAKELLKQTKKQIEKLSK